MAVTSSNAVGGHVSQPATILDSAAMQRAITRICFEILERNAGAGNIVLCGIETRGLPLARRIAERIHIAEGATVKVGALDPTGYRDDRPRSQEPRPITDVTTGQPINVIDRIIILVDDVLFTGRTIRAAMDAVIGQGRPRSIQLAILVDRGHRELPIRADYVGKNVPSAADEEINVLLTETDGSDAVQIQKVA